MEHIIKVERIVAPTGYHYGDLVVKLAVNPKDGVFDFTTEYLSTGLLDTPNALREAADNNITQRFAYN